MSERRFGYEANLMFLFTDVPLEQRPARAAQAGFAAVELWWPFVGPSPKRREVEALAGQLAEAGTQLVCCNLYTGEMAAGERGILSLPGREDEFRSSLEVMARFAELTGCRVFNALYGNRLPGVPPDEQDRLAAEQLRLACEVLALFGATVVLEALNPEENPSYPLTSSAAALAARQRAIDAGATSVALLVDLYQYGRIGESPREVLARTAGAVGHVQIADIPGRHEPGSGDFGVRGLIGPLEDAGWDGWVGLEYRPSTTVEASLAWLGDGELARRPQGGGR